MRSDADACPEGSLVGNRPRTQGLECCVVASSGEELMAGCRLDHGPTQLRDVFNARIPNEDAVGPSRALTTTLTLGR